MIGPLDNKQMTKLLLFLSAVLAEFGAAADLRSAVHADLLCVSTVTGRILDKRIGSITAAGRTESYAFFDDRTALTADDTLFRDIAGRILGDRFDQEKDAYCKCSNDQHKDDDSSDDERSDIDIDVISWHSILLT